MFGGLSLLHVPIRRKHAQFSFMHLQRYKRGYSTMTSYDVYGRL
jgi:hypothetical protein